MSIQKDPVILIIFGAMGDLTWRKLAPALYNLLLGQLLPEKFTVIGLDVKDSVLKDFRDRLKDGAQSFCECGQVDPAKWTQFTQDFSFIKGDFSAPETYAQLSQAIEAYQARVGLKAQRVFYLATPPEIMDTIVTRLGAAGLAKERELSRIVVEKPFGHDLEFAVALNNILTHVFTEKQVYRIDHYLGKETVQNLLVFRFANALFEPIWNRRYIDHIQITVAETVGVEHRGAYYEHAGALRDMIQNHVMQVLTLIAMEPMVSFEADEVRSKKVDVLKAIRPIKEDEISITVVRGQYGPGWIAGQKAIAYREEPAVAPDSRSETFAALKLFIDNWRWQDVPFYLRTGKRLAAKVSEIVINFKPVPHQSFPRSASLAWQPNRLIMHIQPQEGIILGFQAKLPGTGLHLSPVNMHFSYQEAFKTRVPEAYETLLEDVFSADATLFMRADQVEASWKVLTPILEAWGNSIPVDFPNYQAGTWGPGSAEELIARDGRSWLEPVLDELPDENPPLNSVGPISADKKPVGKLYREVDQQGEK